MATTVLIECNSIKLQFLVLEQAHDHHLMSVAPLFEANGIGARIGNMVYKVAQTTEKGRMGVASVMAKKLKLSIVHFPKAKNRI